MKRRQAIGFAAAAIAAAVTPQTRLLAQMSTLAGGSDWSNARWQKAAELPIQVQELYPCVHKGELYVAGGIAARLGVPYFTNRCFAYNADTDRWREVATLPVDLHHAALVSNGRSLFCVGGFNGSYTRVWNMQDTVYELTDQGWNLVSHLPGPQAEGVLAYHPGGNVHLVTGQTPKGQANARRDDHIETSNHWHWDTAARDWSRAEPIPTARNSATGGWLGDYLVVTGGRTAQGNLNVTEIYDMQGDHWHSGAPLPLPQAGTASVVVGAGLLVFGGEIFTPQASVFANVWLYNLREDRWHAIADLPTPRHGLGAGVLNDAVYVIGGATQPGGSGTSNVNECLRR